MTENGTVKGFIYLLFGASVGVVVGLLFAPKTGNETREIILDWLKEKREQSSKVVTDFRNRFPEHKEKVVSALKAGRDVFVRNGSEKETVEA
ncbi:MAG: YtxH domain-containing protein [Elusimicrobiota bacterium]